MKSLSILLLFVAAGAFAADPEKKLRVVMVGDSTMASYAKPPADRPDLTGWGQVFGEFFSDRVEIVNHAASGRSLKSFVAEGRWRKALEAKPDYVVIQFGHNDQKLKDEAGNPATGYRDNLRKYVDEARAVGAKPILVTPVARRTFADGKATSSLGPFADGTKAVAKEKKIAVVDLHQLSFDLFNALGDAGSADFSPSKDDRSHFSRKGAKAIAELVAVQVRETVPELRAFVKVEYGKNPHSIAGSDLFPEAVVVERRPLLHTEQFFGRSAAEAIDRLRTSIKENGGDPERIVKLNIASTDPQIAVHSSYFQLKNGFPHGLPALTYVTGKLADAGAKVGVDAVVVSSIATPNIGTLRPGSRVYVSGQAEKGLSPPEATKNTLASLKKTLDWLGCTPADVVQCRSFLKPISAANDVRKEFEAMFGKDKVPPLVFVEWDSTLPIEIELIANAPKPKDANPPAIEFLTPPGMTASPVYCRVARLNTPETIYLSGIHAMKNGTGTEEVEDVFAQLKGVLAKSGSDFKHLAKATYYVSGNDASTQLNVLRPKFYDPKRPPAASKASVAGVGKKDRTLTMDMIAVKAR